MVALTRSSGVASRPNGIRLRILSNTSPFRVSFRLGVRTAVGARAFTLIPSGAHSKARASVRWETPALIPAYTDRPLMMLRLKVELRLIIFPYPRCQAPSVDIGASNPALPSIRQVILRCPQSFSISPCSSSNSLLIPKSSLA